MATIKGLTIAIGADTKEFNKELKKADRQINTTNKQVDALTKSLDLDFDANRFAEAQRLAQDVLEQTEAKAKALKEQIVFMANHGGVDTENYKKLQTELTKTETKAVLLKGKLQDIKNLKMDKIAGQIQNIGDGITKAGNAIKPFSVAATAALASFVAIGKSSIDAAGNIDDMSQQIGINAESLQKWQYVALQSGLTNDQLQNAFVRTQAALADLSTGTTGPGADALAQLGISTEQAALGMEANLDTIISKLAAIEDPIQKASMANELFGDTLGSKLVPLLNQGGEGLSKLTDEFAALGFMSNEQVESLASFDDKLNKIRYSFTNIKNQLGASMLPLMETFAAFLSDKVVPAVSKVAGWFGNLSLGQQKFIMGALALVAGLAPVLLIVGKITSVIGKLTSSTGALTKALTFLSAHPIIAIIAVIAALVALLYSKNEQFRESIDSLMGSLGGLMPIVDILMDALGSILEALSPIVDILGNVLGGIIEALIPLITLIVNLLSKVLVPVIKAVGAVFKELGKLITSIFEGVVEAIEWMINGVIGLLNGLIKGLNKVGKALGFTIGEIKKVDLGGIKAPDIKADQTFEDKTEQIIQQTKIAGSPQTVINNDYSDRDIKIEVVVQNYGNEVDTDKLVREINIKLAEAM